MDYQNEFKVIDTKEKAYLIGLFYADGCVTTRNAVRISLIDEQLIDDLKILFPFFNKNSYDFSKHNINNQRQYSLSKKSETLHQDFINFGVINNKSQENSELLNLDNIPKEFLSHFIRGYFDGDGSISIPSKRPNLRRVEICSTSLNLMNDFKNVLNEAGINTPIFRKKNLDRNKVLYVLEWVNTQDVLSLREYLYKDNSICLNRKLDLFKSFKPIQKISKNPVCQKCNNFSRKDGKRYQCGKTYQRYYCLNCKFSFQELIILGSNKIGRIDGNVG